MLLLKQHQSVRLGDVIDIRDGTHDTPKYVEQGIPLITSKNLTDSGLCFKDVNFISEDDHREISKRSAVESGDVLYGMIGTIGKPTLVNTDRSFSIKNVALFKQSNPSISNRYLLWLLDSPCINRQITQASKGGTQKFISLGALRDLKAKFPALSEQIRIASILDKADVLRVKRREALVQLDSLMQSIFIEMFGDLMKNPMQFPVHTLGSICDVRDGTHDSPKFVESGFPLVTTKNLKYGTVDFSNVSFISAADFDAINKRSKVDMGDILMPMIGTIGNPVLVEEEPAFAIKNVALIKFSRHSPDSLYILNLLQSEYFGRLVVSKNKGGTQKFLSLGDIRSLSIPLPPVDLQVKFSKLIKQVKLLKTKHMDSCTELDNLFASLQHCAFQGEL